VSTAQALDFFRFARRDSFPMSERRAVDPSLSLRPSMRGLEFSTEYGAL